MLQTGLEHLKGIACASCGRFFGDRPCYRQHDVQSGMSKRSAPSPVLCACVRKIRKRAMLDLLPEIRFVGGHHIGLDLGAGTLYCSLCQDFVYDPEFDAKLVG